MKYVYLIYRVWNDNGMVGDSEYDIWVLEEIWGDREKCEKRREELNKDENDNLYYEMVMKDVL